MAGRRILVPESRELDLFARMLEERGAEAVRCPMVTILDLEDTAPVEAWLKRLVAGDFDDLILLTGEGLRRFLGVAQRDGIEADVVAALKSLRTITRGPKPATVLRTLGLAPGIAAETPTTENVMRRSRAKTSPAAWSACSSIPAIRTSSCSISSAPRARRAIRSCLTATLQMPRRSRLRIRFVLWQRANTTRSPSPARRKSGGCKRSQNNAVSKRSCDKALRDADPAGSRVPVVGAALEKLGFTVAAMPETSFHLKPLVGALIESLATA